MLCFDVACVCSHDPGKMLISWRSECQCPRRVNRGGGDVWSLYVIKMNRGQSQHTVPHALKLRIHAVQTDNTLQQKKFEEIKRSTITITECFDLIRIRACDMKPQDNTPTNLPRNSRKTVFIFGCFRQFSTVTIRHGNTQNASAHETQQHGAENTGTFDAVGKQVLYGTEPKTSA